MTPEGRVKEKIKAWLKKRSIWYFMPVSNGLGRHGIPDFICCWGGRMFAIEAKAPGKAHLGPKSGGPTELQLQTLSEINAAGGLTLVVDDVLQLDDFERKLHADAPR